MCSSGWATARSRSGTSGSGRSFDGCRVGSIQSLVYRRGQSEWEVGSGQQPTHANDSITGYLVNCSNAQLREIYSETLQSALLGAIAAIRIDDQNAQEGRGSWP